MSSPIDDIKDGHEFQRVVAEYFRSLKYEKQDYHISDVLVDDNGVGGDDGCDIVVEFVFEDAIGKHSHRWVVECKSQKRAVGPKDINTSIVDTIIKSKRAKGYLLVCKSDATSSLKRIFKDYNSQNEHDYIVWNGSQLWHKFIKSLKLIEAFFPEYFRKNYIQNNAAESFNNYVSKFENEINNSGEK